LEERVRKKKKYLHCGGKRGVANHRKWGGGERPTNPAPEKR